MRDKIVHRERLDQRRDHNSRFVKALDDIVLMGDIAQKVGCYFIKILQPNLNRRNMVSEYCTKYGGTRRMVTGYFMDRRGTKREVFIAHRLCSVDWEAMHRAVQVKADYVRCRIPLFYDEWKNPQIAHNYYSEAYLQRIRSAIRSSDRKDRSFSIAI